MQVVHYWILPVVSHCQKWFLLPRDYDPVWLEESGLVRVESTNQTQADFLVDCTSARWDRWDTRFGTKTSFTTSSWVNWNRSFVSNWDAICWDVLFRNVQFWITHKYLISVQTKPKWLRRPKAGTRTNGPTNSWSCLYSALDLSTARAGSEFHVYKTPSHTPSSMTSIKVIKRVVSTIKQSTQLTWPCKEVPLQVISWFTIPM